jgi:hypothetical protein
VLPYAAVLSSARELAQQILVQAELLTKELDWFTIDSTLGGAVRTSCLQYVDPLLTVA